MDQGATTLTDAQRRALTILQDGPMFPSDFAPRMWPDSEGWTKVIRSGVRSARRGGGMDTAAGGYLGKLLARGWVRRAWKGRVYCGYELTHQGRTVLQQDG